jgi:hypothetical protein
LLTPPDGLTEPEPCYVLSRRWNLPHNPTFEADIAVSPDGHRLYMTDYATNSVIVVEVGP